MNEFSSSDTSHTEKGPEQEKIVHKRRSSVFHSRRVSFDEDGGVELGFDAERVSETPQEEVFNLEEYVNSLKNERKEWLATYKRRKIERKSLTKQKLRLENDGQPMDLNLLSDSEKAFLSARPNYQHICKSANKLSETALKISVLNDIVYDVNKRFILQMEERLCKIKKKIIETSES